MATLIRPKAWGTTKPAPGGGVNWRHPLAQGLISAVPFAEGGGRPRDFAQNLILGGGTLTFPASGWAMTPLGPGVKFTKNAAEGIKIGLGGVFQPTDGMTIISWYSMANATVENVATLSTGNSATTTALHLSWSVGLGGPYGVWCGGGSLDRPSVVTAWPADATRMFMQAFVHRPNGNGAGRLFLNGHLIATGTTGITGTPPTTDWYIGIDALNTGEAFRGVIVHTLIYRRALLDNEIQWLTAEPYAWAVQPNRLRFAGTSTNIKTVNALTKASVKTVDGLAIGSVKTIGGLT